MISLLRSRLLHYSIPLQRLMQKLGKPEPRVRYEQVREALYLAKPGYCVLTREDYRLTNLFIPGYWSHAAIFDEDLNIIEAVGDGVRKVNAVEMLLKKDDFLILRPHFLESFEAVDAARYAAQQVGIPYDYMFSTNQAWYCSELVYQSYIVASEKGLIPVKAKIVLGELSITPDHFKECPSMIEVYRS